MSAENLRSKDWEHRLQVLWAWRRSRHDSATSDRDKGANYRAVLDGCAVTVRALCCIIGVDCRFTGRFPSDGRNRPQELIACCKKGKSFVSALPPEHQRCLLEVLYLANRAVAHPSDGEGLDHQVGPPEMTDAINTVLVWLQARKSQWPALGGVPEEYFTPIPT